MSSMFLLEIVNELAQCPRIQCLIVRWVVIGWVLKTSEYLMLGANGAGRGNDINSILAFLR